MLASILGLSLVTASRAPRNPRNSTRPQIDGLRLVYAPKTGRELFRPLVRVTAKLAPRLVSLEVSQSQAGSNREKWRQGQAVGE